MDDKQNPNATDPNQTTPDTSGAANRVNTDDATVSEAPTTESQTTTDASDTSESSVPTEPTPAGTTPAGTTPESEDEPNNMTALVIGAIVIALLAIGAAWYVMNDDQMSVTEQPNQPGQGAATGGVELDQGDPDEVVATINGTELNRAEFNRIRQQVLQTAQQQGMDLNDPAAVQQINDQAMQTLVNTELIRQAAVAAGITVSNEDVDARFQEVVQSVGGPDALAESLEQLGLTEESLRGDVEQELIVQGYLEQSIDSDFTASEEDIQAFYDQQGGSENLPPLEDVRDQIEQQLIAMQEQEVIQGILDELRAEAEIETTL